MTAWETLGLPLPEVSGYGYIVDAGLLATPFPSAKPRRSRKHLHNKRTFSLSFLLTQSQLVSATAYLESNGFSWFQMRLLTGEIEGQAVSELEIRAVGDFQTAAVAYNLYRLTLPVEESVEPGVVVGCP